MAPLKPQETGGQTGVPGTTLWNIYLAEKIDFFLGTGPGKSKVRL